MVKDVPYHKHSSRRYYADEKFSLEPFVEGTSKRCDFCERYFNWTNHVYNKFFPEIIWCGCKYKIIERRHVSNKPSLSDADIQKLLKKMTKNRKRLDEEMARKKENPSWDEFNCLLFFRAFFCFVFGGFKLKFDECDECFGIEFCKVLYLYNFERRKPLRHVLTCSDCGESISTTKKYFEYVLKRSKYDWLCGNCHVAKKRLRKLVKK